MAYQKITSNAGFTVTVGALVLMMLVALNYIGAASHQAASAASHHAASVEAARKFNMTFDAYEALRKDMNASGFSTELTNRLIDGYQKCGMLRLQGLPAPDCR